MLWAVLVSGDEGEVDVGGDSGRELYLCLLSSLAEALKNGDVLGEVDALVLFYFILLKFFN
jgi:hypothetical protein